MKIIRVFPRRTSFTPVDDYAFVGDPPMIRPEADEVHISILFTWDMDEAKRLTEAWLQYYGIVYVGGPANAVNKHDGYFAPGKYVRHGVTFTSRGCNFKCPWCLVHIREGNIAELPIHSGNIVQDNNLLQCNKGHIDEVFMMLMHQRAIELSGGLDTRLITDKVADQLRCLNIEQIFLSCDTKEAVVDLRKAIHKLSAFPRDKLRCYVLLAFGQESLSDAEARLEDVWQAGALPFAQLYQPPDKYIEYSKEWTDLARQWSRPAITKSMHKEK